MKSFFDLKLASALGLVSEAYGWPDPAPGRTYDDLRVKQPHVNPETNELWKTKDPEKDPNWDEAHAAKQAWTPEEILLAMVPVIASMAWKIKRTMNPNLDIDELIQIGLTTVLVKGLGRVSEADPGTKGTATEPATREVGEWYDKGLAPFNTYAYRRAQSELLHYAQTGRLSGTIQHGRSLLDKVGQVSMSTPLRGVEGGTMEFGATLPAKVRAVDSVAKNKSLFAKYAEQANLTDAEKIFVQLAYSLFEAPPQAAIEDPKIQALAPGEEPPPEHVAGEFAQVGRRGEVEKAKTSRAGVYGGRETEYLGVEQARGPREIANMINRNQELYEKFLEIGTNVGGNISTATGEVPLPNTALVRTVLIDPKKLSSQGINPRTDSDIVNVETGETLPWIRKTEIGGQPAVQIVSKKSMNDLRKSVALKITSSTQRAMQSNPEAVEAIQRISDHFGAILLEHYLFSGRIVI